MIPVLRTGDGSIGRLRRSSGILPGGAAVPAPLSIRTDRDPAELRRLARRERDGRVSARPACWRSPPRSTACRASKPRGAPG
jgi:hypothetical protein